ncbi:hypothetical protein B0T40_14970 [Chromobacterium haemolyticum]|nr:hypothetical protein B0T40_14970 [Chromobacterium haemolyticum]
MIFDFLRCKAADAALAIDRNLSSRPDRRAIGSRAVRPASFDSIRLNPTQKINYLSFMVFLI